MAVEQGGFDVVPHAAVDAAERHAPAAELDQQSTPMSKTMRWFDGAALGLNSPGAVIAAVGFSIASLGAWWSAALWTIAIVVAFLAARLYTEMAAMFPEKSGGIAMYAEEGWRRYSTLVGPLATWGYWVSWSSGVAVFSTSLATILQTQFFASTSLSVNLGVATLTFPKLVACAIIIACWVINIRGVRFTVLWGYVTGIIALLVLVMLSVAPLVLGDIHGGRLHGHLGGHGLNGIRIGLVWLYVMFWTVGGIEMSASFTPEFRRGWRDTRKSLGAVTVVALITIGLMSLAVAGVMGEHAVAANPSGFLVPAFHHIVPTASWIPTVILVGAFLLIIIACDADSSRTLLGMAEDRMTLRTFAHVSRRGVPSRALTASLIFNLFLVVFVSNTLSIIAAANLGYLLAHFFAVTGFVLLRKDRPDWPRPLRLNRVWLPIAGLLAVIFLGAAVLGATSFNVTGYGGTRELIVGLAILVLAWVFLFIRRVLQDKTGFAWREETPALPPEVAGD